MVVALVEVRSTVTMPGWGEVRGGGHRRRPGRPWWVGSCCWWREFHWAAARATRRSSAGIGRIAGLETAVALTAGWAGRAPLYSVPTWERFED